VAVLYGQFCCPVSFAVQHPLQWVRGYGTISATGRIPPATKQRVHVFRAHFIVILLYSWIPIFGMDQGSDFFSDFRAMPSLCRPCAALCGTLAREPPFCCPSQPLRSSLRGGPRGPVLTCGPQLTLVCDFRAVQSLCRPLPLCPVPWSGNHPSAVFRCPS
jgi:hypothetical protein